MQLELARLEIVNQRHKGNQTEKQVLPPYIAQQALH